MKIQPIDCTEPPAKTEAVVKPVLKSRFMRLFDRPFSSVLKIPAPDKAGAAAKPPYLYNRDGADDLDPSSVCLSKMVQNFIEDNSYGKPEQRCERKRCNCFNGDCTDTSDDEPESSSSPSMDPCEPLKSLVLSVCISERNLLADTAKIVERNKICKLKDAFSRKIVTDGLIALGHNASVCKPKWEKLPSIPAGEYEYVDVITGDERFIIDIDFRSEFEVARPTKAYKQILQTLPSIFVGKADRLEKIIALVCEAAKQSLQKKGMPFPPWRRADYVKAKWLSPMAVSPRSNGFSFELTSPEKVDDVDGSTSAFEEADGKAAAQTPVLKQFQTKDFGAKSLRRGDEVVTGLASLIHEED